MPMKKGTLSNNSYICIPIWILTISVLCPLVKCKSLEVSNKASRMYSGQNMSRY